MSRSAIRIRGVAIMLAALLFVSLTGAPGAPSGLAQSAASPAASAASPAAATGSIVFGGLVIHPGQVTVADLQRLPTETVDVTYQSGNGEEHHSFTGVRLWDALSQVGLVAAPDERNPTLTRFVVVTANDGYRVVFSGGELDPNFGHAPILLAWAQDGQPLTGDNGPLRLVVPGDVKGGRYVHGIIRIDVRSLANPAATPEP
jgi:DMSO/TMAO reductase YedYZ molybdopterin-dependent catalytic subunit